MRTLIEINETLDTYEVTVSDDGVEKILTVEREALVDFIKSEELHEYISDPSTGETRYHDPINYLIDNDREVICEFFKIGHESPLNL